jgi:DNA-binding NtrC family response regulator
MRILIVGNLAARLAATAHGSLGADVEVEYASEPRAALSAAAKSRPVDLYFLEAGAGLAPAIAALRAAHIAAPVIACGYAPSGADEALQAGAAAYITPQSDFREVADAVERALSGSSDIIAADPVMVDVLALADRVARSDATILITGESGVGKEIVARRIHRLSGRADLPMVCVNCAAIPDNLLESELFGHERGAFTGAVARRIGKFEEAHGSTLLLDEISEMDFRLQAKLLRALQERVIDRVGGGKPLRVDVRVIATSNRDLKAEVARGGFREDLFYRLNVVTIRVPPLRERPADAVALADFFAAKFADVNGLPRRALSETARIAVAHGRWPGNVRELENEIHRAVLLSQDGEIDLAPEAEPKPQGAAAVRSLAGRSLAEVERELILDTLSRFEGNRTHAAAALGISIRTLRNKLAAYKAGLRAAVSPPSETTLKRGGGVR